MLAHIAGCEDCYAAFAGTARLLGESASLATPSQSDPSLGATIDRRAAGPSRTPWLVAAAAAVLVTTGLLCWQVASRPVRTEVAPTVGPVADRTTPPLPAARPSAQTPSTGSAAWLRDAPWAEAGRSHYAFAPETRSKRDLLLGMHLAALGRACQGSGTKPDARAVREVDQSLRRSGALALAERLRLRARAEAHDCAFSTDADERPWLEMGRVLEQWRIAVAEKDQTAFDAARGRRLAALVETLHLEGPALPVANRLALRTGAPDKRTFESLAEELDELIELLCG